jgi:cell division protein FtsI/penicillin-binding protein 2
MNINTSIVRLTYTFLGLFLVVSLVMLNVQVFQAQELQASGYNPRNCMADSQPLRGSIYDRSGIKLVWSVEDPNAPCGYRRAWNPDAVKAGLGPVIGYYSNSLGASGIEQTYNDILNGVHPASVGDVENGLLHKRVVGADLYLTIDLKLQEQINALYNLHAEEGGVCQTPGSDPPGSVTVENPQTGEILAMVSRPYYDPSRVDDPSYWSQVIQSSNSPLINRATQGLYVPGSTFKTVTLAAALDAGQVDLQNTTFTRDQVYDFVVDGHDFHWDDAFGGAPFPMSVEQGYAYSVNEVFARVATQIGQQTWLDYVTRFGIQVPGRNVPAVPYDGTSAQSRAYPPGVPLDPVTFAASGFGQGDLQITPLTMTEVASTMAANGQLFVPHAVSRVVPSGQNPQTTSPVASALYGGAPVIRPETAALMRQAMRATVSYGTVSQGQSVQLSLSPAMYGAKTGTGQVDNNRPQTWLITIAPSVNDVSTPGNLAVTVMKEHSGEGACQLFVADDVYRCAAADRDWTPPGNAEIGSCPVSRP